MFYLFHQLTTGPLTRWDKETDRIILRGVVSFGLKKRPVIFGDVGASEVLQWIHSKTNGCNQKTCINPRRECMTGQKLDPETKAAFYE